jgi:Ca2+-binding EF-hand superfamily protein
LEAVVVAKGGAYNHFTDLCQHEVWGFFPGTNPGQFSWLFMERGQVMLRMLLGFATLLALGLPNATTAEEKKEDKTPEKKQEVRRRPSDVVFLLIETSAADDESIAELQRLYDVLRKLDKNNDGKISAEGLKAARDQIVDDRVEHIFKELDADNDGKISKDEAKGRIKEHFDRLDVDKKGFITKDDLRKAIAAHHKAPPKEKE